MLLFTCSLAISTPNVDAAPPPPDDAAWFVVGIASLGGLVVAGAPLAAAGTGALLSAASILLEPNPGLAAAAVFPMLLGGGALLVGSLVVGLGVYAVTRVIAWWWLLRHAQPEKATQLKNWDLRVHFGVLALVAGALAAMCVVGVGGVMVMSGLRPQWFEQGQTPPAGPVYALLGVALLPVPVLFMGLAAATLAPLAWIPWLDG